MVDDLRAPLTDHFRHRARHRSAQDENVIQGVQLRRWTGGRDAALPDDVADVVVEAFGCGLPKRYEDAMVRRARPPAWIVLEYLSAESWVETHHGLPSLHPSLSLARHFFFPGFTPATGGLLRERDLFAQRDAFQFDPAARAEFWRALGVAQPAPGVIVLAFWYPTRRYRRSRAWRRRHAVVFFVPERRRRRARPLPEGEGRTGRHLPCKWCGRIPFGAGDYLAFSASASLRRGEDSFVVRNGPRGICVELVCASGTPTR